MLKILISFVNPCFGPPVFCEIHWTGGASAATVDRMKQLTPYLLIPFLLLGCGEGPSGESADSPSAGEAQMQSDAEPISVVDGVTVVEMTGYDRMKFNLEAFAVPAGASVKLIFRNIGKMPKASMGHNVVFLTKDADPNAFVAAAASARENDYIPAEMEDQILAQTELLGPGESDTVEFTAPSEPGEYVYVCSFPAHMFAGMRGVMTVE